MSVPYLSSAQAAALDEALMSPAEGWSIEQLMARAPLKKRLTEKSCPPLHEIVTNV